MFFGRPYWNLGAVKRCLARLPGFVEREFDTDLSIEPQYEGDGIRTPVTSFGLVKSIPTVLATRRLFQEQREFNENFLNDGFATLEQEYDSMPADIDASFRTLVERDYRVTETNYFRTIFCASLAKLLFKDSFPEADYTKLVAALPEMRHMAPIRALREMAARGETDVTPLLSEFRHHSRRELDIRTPRWDEDREFVEELLRGTNPSGGEDLRPAREKARSEALEKLHPRRRNAFTRSLDRLRRFVWLREEMRDLSSRMYYLIRRTVLEIARRRDLGDDIFFMTFQEIFKDDRSNIERNRAIYESYRNFKAPNEIGAHYSYQPKKSHGALRGIGASPGSAQGVARVALSVEEAARVERGEILVCPFTDPGWTPILDRVAAVVTETGGLLSHAAVICREYGIPAVLGVPHATEAIRDGELIVVSGTEGRVERISTESED
jgi:pyruvate,water dikinase